MHPLQLYVQADALALVVPHIEFLGNRILTKKDFTYAINTAWLDEITKFGRIMKERYDNNQPFG